MRYRHQLSKRAGMNETSRLGLPMLSICPMIEHQWCCRGGRCRARRADSPILAPMIPFGEHGEASHQRCACLLAGPPLRCATLPFAHVLCETCVHCSLQEGTDLMSYLLRNRIIFVGSRIGDEVCYP